jgi:CII-binding regulator of phage lambda lysogenization HflD
MDDWRFKELRDDQKELAKKFDALHHYITEHMEEEGKNLTELKVSVARLEEKVSQSAGRWGFVSTIVTAAIVSVISVFTGQVLQK